MESYSKNSRQGNIFADYTKAYPSTTGWPAARLLRDYKTYRITFSFFKSVFVAIRTFSHESWIITERVLFSSTSGPDGILRGVRVSVRSRQRLIQCSLKFTRCFSASGGQATTRGPHVANFRGNVGLGMNKLHSFVCWPPPAQNCYSIEILGNDVFLQEIKEGNDSTVPTVLQNSRVAIIKI